MPGSGHRCESPGRCTDLNPGTGRTRRTCAEGVQKLDVSVSLPSCRRRQIVLVSRRSTGSARAHGDRDRTAPIVQPVGRPVLKLLRQLGDLLGWRGAQQDPGALPARVGMDAHLPDPDPARRHHVPEHRPHRPATASTARQRKVMTELDGLTKRSRPVAPEPCRATLFAPTTSAPALSSMSARPSRLHDYSCLPAHLNTR